MKVRPGLATLVGLLLLLASAPPAVVAYNTIPCLWSDATETYWMYTGVAADQTAYLNGKSAWNTLTGIAFVSSGHVDTEDIGLNSVNDNSVAWDGTSVVFCNAGHITYVTIKINDFKTNAYSAGKRQSVTAHELGHSLGLAHRSGAYLMNGATCGTNSRYCSFFINEPQPDEIQFVADKY
jgi:hypothetical protein